MSVQVGDKAPLFALKDKDGVIHSLGSVSTPYTIVYFYPKDDTPGCTVEAKEFTRNLEMLRRAGATVFGISGGDERTKSRFCEKHSLSVALSARNSSWAGSISA
jgi:thioredoxin-dependent peroxiredoxin